MAPVNRGGGVPAQPNPLLGREGELQLARSVLLRDEVRLLTFRGPAGVGKTRLALATADTLGDRFDEICVVDLAAVAEASQIGAAIAEALGVPGEADQSLLARLASRLADSNTLLVLDNFEHIMPAAAFLVALLAHCPTIKMLVTSREALRLRWEFVFPVRPLLLPQPQLELNVPQLLESPAVQLFVDRAQAADPSFTLTLDNAAAVANVCIQLDGLPLAIELAAGRTPMLPPSAMLGQLRHRLDVLRDGAYDLPERQRSARAAIGYSYALLSVQERTLFRQLSVFVNGCTPDAAAAVALGVVDPASLGPDRPSHDAGPMLDSLAALAQKSLLSHEPQPGGEVRFRMLKTVRAFADEQLQMSGEQVQARARAIAYFTALAQQAEVGLQGHYQSAWLALLGLEHDNIGSALRWCIDDGDAQGGMELAGRLARFWELGGYYAEARGWLDELLALPASNGQTAARGLALSAAAMLAASQGDDSRAEVLETEALKIRRDLGDRLGYARSQAALALLIHQRGDTQRARTMLEESLAVSRDLGDRWGIAQAQHQLGEVATDQAQYPTARACYAESIVLWHELEDAWGIARCLDGLGILAQLRGDSARALRLIGAAGGLRQGIHSSVHAPIQRLQLQQAVRAAETGLGPTASAASFAAGQAMNLDEAVLYARTVAEHPPVAPAPTVTPQPAGPFAWLTRREQEVATLLLRGLSNRQIAEGLVITERTAETHVCRILSKLGLASRAQISAWAMDQTLAAQPGRAAGQAGQV